MSVRAQCAVSINRSHGLHPLQGRVCCHGGHHGGAGGCPL